MAKLVIEIDLELEPDAKGMLAAIIEQISENGLPTKDIPFRLFDSNTQPCGSVRVTE